MIILSISQFVLFSSQEKRFINTYIRELLFNYKFCLIGEPIYLFSKISVFDQIFSFLVHYSLSLKITSPIRKIMFLFSILSTDRDYNKQLYIKYSNLLFEQY